MHSMASSCKRTMLLQPPLAMRSAHRPLSGMVHFSSRRLALRGKEAIGRLINYSFEKKVSHTYGPLLCFRGGPRFFGVSTRSITTSCSQEVVIPPLSLASAPTRPRSVEELRWMDLPLPLLLLPLAVLASWYDAAIIRATTSV
eukprot:TRINITY_DN15388_c0_g1_i1.p2 TRINITY_DN15388_c0_g1~~TRINITY_DN15388_c0_g1_i1.p2  ORF type:complete len:143 (-),score=12.56 TRINITY_DN15388_c0_g1_i1:29-457(-)